METITFTADALVRRQIRVWLAQLDLNYSESSGIFSSDFVVRVRTDRDADAVDSLRARIVSIVRSGNELKHQDPVTEGAKKLEKVSFFRKVSFRKILKQLDQ